MSLLGTGCAMAICSPIQSLHPEAYLVTFEKSRHVLSATDPLLRTTLDLLFRIARIIYARSAVLRWREKEE